MQPPEPPPDPPKKDLAERIGQYTEKTDPKAATEIFMSERNRKKLEIIRQRVKAMQTGI